MIINGFKIHPDLLPAGLRRALCAAGMPRRVLRGWGVAGWRTAEKSLCRKSRLSKRNLPEERRDPNTWFSAPSADEDSPDGAVIGTNGVDDPCHPGETCCVFLRPDRLCALQVTSGQLGLEYPGLKPMFCALYPLQLRENEIVIDHETAQNLGNAACLRACADQQPMHRIFKEELALVLGEEGYEELDKRLQAE